MSECYATAYVSGDLGQALALKKGAAWLVDARGVHSATTADINIFFDTALDFKAIPPDLVDRLDADGLSAMVVRATATADALRFLLMGMDRSLSDGLRVTAVAQASLLLDSEEAVAHIREHFLRLAEPDPWDPQSAAAFAALIGADLPTLLYLAADSPGDIDRLKTTDPGDWSAADARTQLARRLGRGSDGTNRPLWELVLDWLSGPLLDERGWLSAAKAFADRFEDIEVVGVQAAVARARIAEAALQYRRSRQPGPAIAGFEHAIARLGPGNPCFAPTAAMALVCKAAMLSTAGSHTDALETCIEAVALVADRDDGLSRVWSASGQFAIARNLSALGRTAQAIEQYLALVAAFHREGALRFRILVAKSRYNRASGLLGLGDTFGARDAWVELIHTLEAGESGALQLLHAKSLYNLGCVHDMLREPATATRFYLAAIDACAGIAGEESKGVLEDALYNLGTVFAARGNHREAIQAYGRAIDSIGETADTDRQLLAAQASFNLGLSLEVVGRLADADSAYRLVETRFVLVADARRVVAKAHARRLSLGEQDAPIGAAAPEAGSDGDSDAGFAPRVLGTSEDDA